LGASLSWNESEKILTVKDYKEYNQTLLPTQAIKLGTEQNTK